MWLANSSSNFLPTKLHPNPVKLIQVWHSHLLAFLLALGMHVPLHIPQGLHGSHLPPWATQVFLPELSTGRLLSYCLWLRTGKGCWQTFAPKGKSRLWLCNFSSAPLCTSDCLLDPSCCYSSLLVWSGKVLRLCSNTKVASTLLTAIFLPITCHHSWTLCHLIVLQGHQYQWLLFQPPSLIINFLDSYH